MKLKVEGLIFVAVTFTAWRVYGGWVASSLWWMSLFLLLFSFVMSCYYRWRCQVRVEISAGRIEAGDEVPITWTFANNGLVGVPFIDLLLLDRQEGISLSVGAQDEERVVDLKHPRVRGLQKGERAKVLMEDALGFATQGKILSSPDYMVYPKLKEGPTPFLNAQTLGEGQRFRFFTRENPYEVREMRKYRSGDNIRRIHWKISAKTGELFVKRGDALVSWEVLICLDASASLWTKDPTGVFENQLVTDALSLSQSLIHQGIAHAFWVADRESVFAPVASKEQGEALTEYFLTHFCGREEPLFLPIEAHREVLLDASALFFFTKGDAQDLSAIESLVRRGNEVCVFAPHLSRRPEGEPHPDLILWSLEDAAYGLD
ncbi:hypothetical protein ABB02_01686 [Clostridiaceae bacterium JG1575]|nr:hypothetical protein ABB02_01686 [Clostridiaceae bacterium JG1575]